MNSLVSVIIPCYNSANTIHLCLDSIYRSDYPNYEIIVVDDHSTDESLKVISQYDCKIVHLLNNRGAGDARNAGVDAACGKYLFFTDADCVIQQNTLSIAVQALAVRNNNVIIGGTYTQQPYDSSFYSQFQSIFIHYAETKYPKKPDYIATHALAMPTQLFREYNGFTNSEYPILEDVEYSHRLKRNGVMLEIIPQLQVQHIFNFSFSRSMRNAVTKAKFWTAYTLKHRSLLEDSGTASIELKFNTFTYLFSILFLSLFILIKQPLFLVTLLLIAIANATINWRFLQSIYHAFGAIYTLPACSYYFGVYPLAVAYGSALGITHHLSSLCTIKSTTKYKMQNKEKHPIADTSRGQR